MEKLHLYYDQLEKLAIGIAIADTNLACETKSAFCDKIRKEFALNESISYNWAREKEEGNRDINNYPSLKESLATFSNFVEVHYEPGDRFLLERSVSFLEKIAKTYSGENQRLILEMLKNEICGLIYV